LNIGEKFSRRRYAQLFPRFNAKDSGNYPKLMFDDENVSIQAPPEAKD